MNDNDGNASTCPYQPPRPPPRVSRPISLPGVVARQLRAKLVRVLPVIGNSMEPTVLDNDYVVVSSKRPPRDGDIVLVKRNLHRVYGRVSEVLYRYKYRKGRGYLKKDHPQYVGEWPVTAREIVGVVTRVLPRQYRDEQENYYQIQRIKYARRDIASEDPDLGFESACTLARLRTIVNIPPSELIDGRLPWGLFRGIAIADHPHVDIVAGDTLVIEPNRVSYVGVIAIKCNRRGDTIVGLLQREDPEASKPGPFFMQLADRRVTVTRRNGYPLWHTIARVKQIERRQRRAYKKTR